MGFEIVQSRFNPHIYNGYNIKVKDNGDGTVTIEENQMLQLANAIINTSDFSLEERTFAIGLGEAVQLRYSLNGRTVTVGTDANDNTIQDVSPNKNSFYTAPLVFQGWNSIYSQYPDDIALARITRDATTGVINIYPIFVSSTLEDLQNNVGLPLIVLDATNGNDSTAHGTLANPFKTLDAALNYSLEYGSSRSITINDSSTYTWLNPFYCRYLNINKSSTVTTNPTIQFTTGCFGLSDSFNVEISHVDINATNATGYSFMGNGGEIGKICFNNATVTLNGTYSLIHAGSWCHPNVLVWYSSVIKTGTGLLLDLIGQSTLVYVDFISSTVQDSVGNALTPTDVVSTIRDSSGTIRNYCSSTIK